jgi:hypothetical protein
MSCFLSLFLSIITAVSDSYVLPQINKTGHEMSYVRVEIGTPDFRMSLAQLGENHTKSLLFRKVQYGVSYVFVLPR